ncbi:Med7p [Sugiyamaella lignohabitans]|uniref:Mediator of RNA polymerase II transcription subunit 7 n=1 Tax=Sugiyamaella lignohabitans TaxID=796027 RepID=A0A167FG55_9ASCO|nr:Med7p [Sugiyamaella lignohabitans]ANB15256.1 Med7p [Sugiyamaella lignohabitans]
MSGISSVYPPPPWYYKHFTKANIEKFEQLQRERKEQKPNDLETTIKGEQGNDGIQPTVSVKIETETSEPSQPAELAKTVDESSEKPLEFPLNLLEPPTRPPNTTSYRGFGNIWQVDDKLLPLEEVGIRQLYQDIGKGSNGTVVASSSSEVVPIASESVQASHKEQIWELKKLLKSVLVNFLELVGIMATAPEKFPAKVEDIRVIVINMHHLLNEYRPHQARESLVLLIEDQIQTRRSEINSLKESNDAIRNKITGLAQQLTGILAETTAKAADLNQEYLASTSHQDELPTSGDRKTRDLALWDLLQRQGIQI